MVFLAESLKIKEATWKYRRGSPISIEPHDKCASLIGKVTEIDANGLALQAICSQCEWSVPIDWPREHESRVKLFE
jgi:hypothetical protein